jgi:2-keto-4-pentenoate hydratase/2-oxohepta-3-ene-1,7-dioic acid hydratase in catechol pathway
MNRSTIALSAGAVLVLLCVVFLSLRHQRLSGVLSVDNPRFEHGAHDPKPPDNAAILRYVSRAEGFDGKVCFGLLLESDGGIPTKVLNLTALEPALGSTFETFLPARGFDVADDWLLRRGGPLEERFLETIAQGELASRILSPVDVTLDQLDAESRFVVGVGFNYAKHREESGTDIDELAFAKVVEPTGAYQPLPTEGRLLTDYEVEVAFVLLEDIDLGNVPDNDTLYSKIAFLNGNDVSDREPLILRDAEGFTVAKSRPGACPLGPWMIHGRNLPVRTGAAGSVDLGLTLTVDEIQPHRRGTGRQKSQSSLMIRGVKDILEMIGRIHEESVRPDESGAMRGIARVDGPKVVLPAGSIVLTGTPEGTAIEAPTTFDQIRLFARSNLTLTSARRRFLSHCIENRLEMGFLQPGDVVTASIDRLGTQRWRVVE